MIRIDKFRAAICAVVLCIGLLYAPARARAQTANEDIPELGKDWNLRVGVFIPNSSTARSAVGSVGFSGIVERTVFETKSYDINVGISYNGYGDTYSVPIMASVIGKSGNVRYGAGVGYDFGKRLNGEGSNGSVIGLILGYRLTRGANSLSLDARYNFVSGSNNELDGYSITLGMRF